MQKTIEVRTTTTNQQQDQNLTPSTKKRTKTFITSKNSIFYLNRQTENKHQHQEADGNNYFVRTSRRDWLCTLYNPNVESHDLAWNCFGYDAV